MEIALKRTTEASVRGQAEIARSTDERKAIYMCPRDMHRFQARMAAAWVTDHWRELQPQEHTIRHTSANLPSGRMDSK